MILEEIQKISKDSEFSILPYTQNRNLWYLGKRSPTSNFDSCCSLIFRNDKNELRQKFCPVPKIEKFETLETFLSLQIFTVVVTCSKFVCSKEMVKSGFLWLLILTHVFPENFIEVPQVVQKIWRFSRSIFGLVPDTSL